jgi:hypothetical protein
MTGKRHVLVKVYHRQERGEVERRERVECCHTLTIEWVELNAQ